MSDKHIQTHLKNFEFSTLCKKVKINYNNLVFSHFLEGLNLESFGLEK